MIPDQQPLALFTTDYFAAMGVEFWPVCATWLSSIFLSLGAGYSQKVHYLW